MLWLLVTARRFTLLIYCDSVKFGLFRGSRPNGTYSMKKLMPITSDPSLLRQQLDEFDDFLNNSSHLQERKQVLPFFKKRPLLVAALGLLSGGEEAPDRYALELDLYGDFQCDAASGDSNNGHFTLIEFEDAQPNSIFGRPSATGGLPRWSPRFEHGFSQLVDWARILSSQINTDKTQEIFGLRDPHVNFLLVIGRKADLQNEIDKKRLDWWTKNVSFASHKMTCFTFDDVLSGLRSRLNYIDPL